MYCSKTRPLNDEKRFFEETFERLMTLRNSPFPDRLKADDLLRQRATEASGKKLPVIEAIFAGHTNDVETEAVCLARLRIATTAVALEQFRASHGSSYPGSLSELAPAVLRAVPADPFNGQPLHYKPDGTGYTLCGNVAGKSDSVTFSVVAPPKPHS